MATTSLRQSGTTRNRSFYTRLPIPLPPRLRRNPRRPELAKIIPTKYEIPIKPTEMKHRLHSSQKNQPTRSPCPSCGNFRHRLSQSQDDNIGAPSGTPQKKFPYCKSSRSREKRRIPLTGLVSPGIFNNFPLDECQDNTHSPLPAFLSPGHPCRRGNSARRQQGGAGRGSRTIGARKTPSKTFRKR